MEQAPSRMGTSGVAEKADVTLQSVRTSALMEQVPSRMGTSDVAGKADVLQECASSSAVTPNFLTPLENHSSDAEAASSIYYSARSEWLSEVRSNCKNELEFDIESSKSHWTEVSAASAKSDDSDEQVPSSVVSASSNDGDDEVATRNRVAFEEMKNDPEWSPFFQKQPFELMIGVKIAEGGQAEIFEALGKYKYLDQYQLPDIKRRFNKEIKHKEIKLVLKVFKKGYSLDDLKRSWPPGKAYARFLLKYLPHSINGYDYDVINLCWAQGAHLMIDGRFAFIFDRHQGDLRKLIDKRMLKGKGCPPFDGYTTLHHIKNIARGMYKLHQLGVVHNDPKAANVLVSELMTLVADFESSVGTVGTGFWRAPEVLLALKNSSWSGELFT